ncbi:MAG: arylsulfatase [Kiritimatiellia bacterium]
MRDEAERPNIVLIIADQWRGDCLSIAGHPVVHTPYLDDLALRGARFSRAYSATPTCIPARAALFTGLTQRSHRRVGYQDGVPWDYPVTLAGEFTRHGYQTQAVGKMHVYPERSQMGFQNVILHDGYLHYARRGKNLDLIDDYLPWLRRELGRDADYFEHGLNCNSIVARPWDKEEYLHPTNYVTAQAIDFLRRRDPRKPFFLFISYHRPHPPYDPPSWAFEQYIGRDMPQPPRGDWVEVLKPYATPGRSDAFVDPTVPPYLLQRARAGYYGHITHIDQQINRFLETLAEYDLRDSTVVMFVADHGEMLGDHTLFRKAYPYEGSARVPLLLSGPGWLGIKPNCVHSHVIELRDIMPTLLDCAGLPIPPSVEGKSFLPIARGEAVSWRQYLHGEHVIFGQSLQWLTDGREKYVWWSGTGYEQLFDLQNDSQECVNLAAQSANEARLTVWREQLVAELTGREEGFSDGHRLIVGCPVKNVLSANAGETAM